MKKIKFRKAELSDINIFFKWINEAEVRANSFDSNIVTWEEHVKWFNEKIYDPNYSFYLFQNNNDDYIGQIRINKINDIDSIVGVSVCNDFRGLGYGAQIIEEASNDYFKSFKNSIINAYIKSDNISSKKIFEKAGFSWLRNIMYNNFNTNQYVLHADRKL
jgi:RimJ/RimL family protein N-acetyltransferase